MTNQEVGERIRLLREQRRLNRNELANAAGISPTYIYQLEKGEKSPTVEYLGYLCDALGISVADFFQQPTTPSADKLSRLTPTQQKHLNDFLNSLDQ